ncbi:probable E3 ubiquitin-protein ligase HERC4 [Triplophysa dalaica]|uniref:probable E3 ubiquitin-protein ligase HERC4 n=1 Tax=Triplophysa dalaica TaxID=1582913 RepID=UPI0024DF8B4A|nr:probable E3 ubiquitin-protein ligase HERC4 [Triplophysa dalaica]
MLCYWGAQVREGFGLTQPDKVKHVNDGIRCVCPTSEIQDMSAGKYSFGFIQNEKVSVLRLRGDNNGLDEKLKPLNLKKDRIKSIACGESGGVVLAYGGKVFIINKSTLCTPLKDLSNRHVIQISCGDQHSMALTQEGQVFVWGENSHGQLGLGEGRSGSQTPQHVQCLDGVPLAQISAGGDHSFVLSLSGVVFGWGKNSSGQLGLGNTTDRHVPTVVRSLNGKKTEFISCGGEHTATLSKGGTVFTFGSGVYGQLGHNTFKDEHLPQVVSELWGSKVSQVTCGRHHTLVLVASSKRIYSFGCGMQGQLGNGQMTNQSVPSAVLLPAEFNDKYTIGKLFAGENHSFALFYKVPGNKSTKPKSNQSGRIVTLDDKMIDQWASECNSKSWKAVKNKIYKVFSSAASLNGSFLKTSCDEHYQTSAEVSGLDFELVKKALAKLSMDERVMSKVVKTVHGTLLPSLKTLSLVSVEVLRIYLLLPELIRVCQEQDRAKLLEGLASNILQLNSDALKVLETYWSKLPDDCLKGLVKLFCKETSKSIGRIAVDGINLNAPKRLEQLAQVLQMFYKVCCNAHNKITKSHFIINEINDLLDTLQSITEDLNNPLHNENLPALMILVNYYDQTLKKLKSFPCIFNLEAKCRFMKNKLHPRYYPLLLRRTALLDDCFRELKKSNDQDLKGLLVVRYAEDVTYRSDVNKRDFFLNVFKELRKPDSQFFMYNDNKTMIWFPSQPSVEKEKYLLLGILCGLAFNNSCVVHLPFPLALFKKLLNVKPSLQDLKEFDPVFGQSLEHVLNYCGDVLEEMEMPLTVTWDGREVELDPTNPRNFVTNSNKTEFVDNCVDYTLNKSVEEVFEEFKTGFFKGCDKDLVVMFEPEELRGLLVGNEDYDWDILKQNTTYEGLLYAEHLTVISFWQVFEELTSNQKKTFLLFLTGFERVPILGMSQVKMTVRNLLNSTEEHLPQALTCHSLLELPIHQGRAKLKEKLIEALNHKRGFWEE